MKTEVLNDAEAVAQRGAAIVAAASRAAVAQRGRFTVAVSGGSTPWQMLRALAGEEVPWAQWQVFQVDERAAPAGDPDRNLTHLSESLLSHAPLNLSQIHAMPVEGLDLAAGAAAYANELQAIAGSPPVIDLVHLGLGPDGHTASLVPGDAVLDVRDALVGITADYRGRRRMTLTYPVLNAARQILWLVTGAEKQTALKQLLVADPSIPAGRVEQSRAILVGDRAAFGSALAEARPS